MTRSQKISNQDFPKQLWEDILQSTEGLRDVHSSWQDNVLFHGAAPHHYVKGYRLTAWHWVNAPLLSWKFSRAQKSTTGKLADPNLAKTDQYLSDIEFAKKPLSPLQRHRVRRAQLEHMLSTRDTSLAFSAVGLRTEHGRLQHYSQPRWLYWSALIMCLAFLMLSAFVIVVAIRVIANNGQFVQGSFSLLFLALLFAWFSHMFYALGPQWKRAETNREVLSIRLL